MSLLTGVNKYSVKLLTDSLQQLSLQSTAFVQLRWGGRYNRPKLRHPKWLIKKERSLEDDLVVPENTAFVKEIVRERYGLPKIEDGVIVYEFDSPLQRAYEAPTPVEWNPTIRRCGVIARKIGIYPLWTKNGKRKMTTLLQVLDNQVVKYSPPEDYTTARTTALPIKRRKGCLLIGAESADPSLLTKEYFGLFKDTGVSPKKILARFFVTPEAVLPVGCTLNACHFRVGDIVDVRAKTIDRGFQGVMKRWGFSGMPASHGVTKTHRRGGNVGGGGEKGRIWPGTKMPGHMGNRYRLAKGLKIWRINTKYSVLWVSGQAIPGDTNSICFIYDTIVPTHREMMSPPVPTYIPNDSDELPENIYEETIHSFADPTITFSET